MAKIIVCNFILNQCVCIFVFKPFVDKIAFVYICVFGSVGLKLGVGSHVMRVSGISTVLKLGNEC